MKNPQAFWARPFRWLWFKGTRRQWLMAPLGLFSVYLIWAIPAFIFDWDEWFSFAYKYGDHFVLPLFNMIAFWLLALRRGSIPRWSVIVVLLAGGLIASFEPDAAQMRETGTLMSWLRVHHLVFVTLQFAFIVFMCGVYPFLRTRGQYLLPSKIQLRVLGRKLSLYWWMALTPLFALVLCFLAFVFVADDWTHNFPLWNKGTTSGLVVLAYILIVTDRIFGSRNPVARAAKAVKKAAQAAKPGK